MLKLLGTVMILGACSALGLSAKQRLRQRLRALEAMIAALQFISSELTCRMTPLPELIAALAQSENGITRKIFGVMYKKMGQDDGLSLPYKWCRAFQECREQAGLGEEETHLLCDAAGFLGRYDAAQQVKSLEYVRRRLGDLRLAAVEELRSKGNLYRTCGIAMGIVTVLVLL
ncbi:stage III sporulation protein AB [Intestinibacillus massiliensis]|nr:stage III sporulation protein AB [Intestinibacillus massiliensis]